MTESGEEQIGPAPDTGSHPTADKSPMLSFELPELNTAVRFPEVIEPQQRPAPGSSYSLGEFDELTQQELLDICSLDIISFNEMLAQDKEVLWEKRHFLGNVPGALPKVLLAAHSWDCACLPGLYGLLDCYAKPEPMDILQLFLPIFPDVHVRQVAIDWLSEKVSSDDLVDFLPQLLEALKHETWATSPLAQLLLERSLSSPRLAHSLYWLLTQCLPGQCPQNTTVSTPSILDRNKIDIKVARYRRRLQMIMRTLEMICGENLRNAFLKQQVLTRVMERFY